MKPPLLNRLLNGFFAIFRGMRLIASSGRLKILAIIPFFVTVLLFVLGLAWAVGNLGPIVVSMTSLLVAGGFWGVTLQWLALLMAWPAFLLALFFVVFLIAKVIAAPFHSLLAEQALIQKSVIADQGFELRRWLWVSIRMMWISLLKAVVLLPIGILLFVLSFIPVVNILAAFGVFLIVAFDSVDYSFEAMQFGLRQRFSYFGQNLPEFCGLAGALGLVLLVPGLNFFLFPAAVVGSSDLVGRIQLHAKGVS